MPKLARRLYYWLNRGRFERDLAEEIELHRAMKQQQLEQSGMTGADATDASRRALGNATLAIEDARDVWIWPSLERLVQDVRYGLRMLRRQPTFALTTILTLSIGIGVTTAVFSVVEFEMWKPLPFPNPDRLVAMYSSGPGSRFRHDRVSAPELIDWRAQSHAFGDIAAHGSQNRRVVKGLKAPESLSVMPVTANFFDVLGLPPALGRSFASGEDRGPARSAILGDACWRRVFNADPGVIGHTLNIDDAPYSIIGVASASPLEFMSSPDAFITTNLNASTDRAERTLSAIGRLKDGIALASASADLQTVAQQLEQAYPNEYKGRGARLEDLRANSTGYNWRPLFFFLGAALFVLALTCVNVASLLLARALGRDREFAIRRALGGGHAALTRQLIVEGSLLTFPAAGVGLLLATWAVALLPPWLPESYLSRGTHIDLDVRVYLFALAIAGLTAILFGSAPAVLTSRRDLNPIIGSGSRTVAGSRRQQRARHALVVIEVMLALILLVGAGLFVNSFVRLTRIPLGFEPSDRLIMSISASGALYTDRRELAGFAKALTERARAVPGVVDAAVGNSAPLGSGPLLPFAVAGKPAPGEGLESIGRAITSDFFRTLGIRIVAGRDFAANDTEGAPRVAIVNETLVKRAFPGGNPIGRELVLQPNRRTTWVQQGSVRIVGVVANIKNVGINEVEFNNIFLPFAQSPHSSVKLIVHAAVPPSSVVDPIRQAVLGLDKTLPVYDVRTMARLVDDAFMGSRFNLLLIVTFAVLAMVMAAVGIYGAMSYTVEQRTREFGVRLALGAPRSGVLALALGQAARLGAAGTGLGVAASLVIAKILGTALYLVPRQHDGIIYDVSMTDPLTLICAAAGVLIVAGSAGLVPARRAMHVDPVVALRAE